MRAATCFPGIGAPEVAMPDWDWLWHADIEGFPNAVMAARHPESKNLGDVTADDFLQMASAFGKIDVLAGGPPCQDFSVAGLRLGIGGDRGNLTFRFLEITHAIRPRNLLVENVPGWLNMPDNAFGSFLGGLVGADDALLPCAKPPVGKSNAFWNWRNAGMGWQLVEPDEDGFRTIIEDPRDYDPSEIERVELDARHIPSWPSAGMVAGPRSRAAWRVLNAQHFGVAQRRLRVFVVADFGNGACPAKVLFEPKSVRGNFAPSEETGKDVAGTIAARTRGGSGLGTDFDLDGGLVPDKTEVVTARMVAFGEYETDGTASTIKQRDYKDATDLVVQRAVSFKPSHYTRGKDGAPAEISPPLSADADKGDQDAVLLVPDVAQTEAIAFSMRGREGGNMPEISGDVVSGLRAASGGSTRDHVAVGLPDTAWSVRRLTPTECARLQGFGDDYCNITYRGKPAADGPIYKALGNSWAVPCGRWILERIERFMP